ncbi:hypothetical protein HYFRA_00007016 [Hymenoscyphus fraxineus]|uniref:Uncharacterized protein n=1 Tax=Hymenoscyphus fraxineus TaxID=746836 RepID=A0A9N9KMK2_9HELO|nr:hypothetical protein HYFRA_00007016 [Hymenoscyphus fraxineus]
MRLVRQLQSNNLILHRNASGRCLSLYPINKQSTTHTSANMRAVQAILFFSAAVGVMAGCQKGTESCSNSNVKAAEGGFHNSWKCEEAGERPCNGECMITGSQAVGPNPGFNNDPNQMLTTMCCKC